MVVEAAPDVDSSSWTLSGRARSGSLERVVAPHGVPVVASMPQSPGSRPVPLERVVLNRHVPALGSTRVGGQGPIIRLEHVAAERHASQRHWMPGLPPLGRAVCAMLSEISRRCCSRSVTLRISPKSGNAPMNESSHRWNVLFRRSRRRSLRRTAGSPGERSRRPRSGTVVPTVDPSSMTPSRGCPSSRPRRSPSTTGSFSTFAW